MNKDSHSDPNVESSHTKIDNYFANYFLKTDAKKQVLYGSKIFVFRAMKSICEFLK